MFFDWFNRNNENSKKYKLKKAMSYNNKKIDYVTERLESGEVVLGKDGYVSVKNGLFIVCCQGSVLFEARADEISCGELLSRNGVIINGVDVQTGNERSIVIHFVYYR